MTTAAVAPLSMASTDTTAPQPLYHAVAGDKQAAGRTKAEALAALAPLLEEDDDAATLVIVQQQRPDRFFSARQQQRREELTAQWRTAQDAGSNLPPAIQAELEQLVLAEVRAAGQRAADLLRGKATP